MFTSVLFILVFLVLVLLITSIIEKLLGIKIMRRVMIILFVIYIILLVVVLFRPYRLFNRYSVLNISDYFSLNSNFIPFRTIYGYFKSVMDGSISKSIFFENIIGNIVLFMPMGIFLPSITYKLREMMKFINVMLIMLVVVEVGQIMIGVGSIDVDDIILNMSGATISFLIWRLNITQNLLVKLNII